MKSIDVEDIKALRFSIRESSYLKKERERQMEIQSLLKRHEKLLESKREALNESDLSNSSKWDSIKIGKRGNSKNLAEYKGIDSTDIYLPSDIKINNPLQVKDSIIISSSSHKNPFKRSFNNT
jgi:hypothetical protein